MEEDVVKNLNIYVAMFFHMVKCLELNREDRVFIEYHIYAVSISHPAFILWKIIDFLFKFSYEAFIRGATN